MRPWSLNIRGVSKLNIFCYFRQNKRDTQNSSSLEISITFIAVSVPMSPSCPVRGGTFVQGGPLLFIPVSPRIFKYACNSHNKQWSQRASYAFTCDQPLGPNSGYWPLPPIYCPYNTLIQWIERLALESDLKAIYHSSLIWQIFWTEHPYVYKILSTPLYSEFHNLRCLWG